MRVLLAGATGVVGRPLVPRLVAERHRVTAITRKHEAQSQLEAQGAEAALCDVLDRDRLRHVVQQAWPEAVIQHLTDLPADLNPRNLKQASPPGANGSSPLSAERAPRALADLGPS